VDYQDNTIAHLAAFNGNIEILKLLQQNDVDLRAKNRKVLPKWKIDIIFEGININAFSGLRKLIYHVGLSEGVH
jgi:ankyrin repeat protein